MERKKKAEGIALLSMYNDEDMDVDDDDEDHRHGNADDLGHHDNGGGSIADGGVAGEDEDEDDENGGDLDHDGVRNTESGDEMPKDSSALPIPVASDSVPSGMPNEGFSLESRSPSPVPVIPTPPLVSAVGDSDGRKTTGTSLTIVDYAHDESAWSPEEEEGEVLNMAQFVLGAEPQGTNGASYRAPPGSVRILTPSKSETAPTVPQNDEPKSDIDFDQSSIVKEAEADKNAEATGVPVEEASNENVDPLEKFLPPPPTSKCSEELQAKIVKFLDLMKKGRSFNEELRNSKGYRNPDFLQHAVRYQEIDQLGTCFSKDVFDPYGYDKSDYYDEIAFFVQLIEESLKHGEERKSAKKILREAEMKREMERKEQEKKRNQKIEFNQGSLLSAPSTKAQVTVPMLSASAVAVNLPSLLPTPAMGDALPKDRQNKKSKWDKVDSDRKIPLPAGGQDNVSAVGAHAALLSAANAGAGYTAFAQQKRKEAAERKSSEKSGKELGK